MAAVAHESPAGTSVRVRLAGIDVQSFTRDQLHSYLCAAADAGDRQLRSVGYLNAHVFNLAWRKIPLRTVLQNATVIYADGVSVRWGARITGQPVPERITAADWFDEMLLSLGTMERRIFLLGGAITVAECFAEYLHSRGLAHGVIAGVHSGYFNQSEEPEIIAQINQSGASILILGMGTPHQELFFARWQSQLTVPVVWWVGAAMDYYTGIQNRGPEWARTIGHEWIGRLWSNPLRLAGRYLIGNPLFLIRVWLKRKDRLKSVAEVRR